MFQFLRRVSGSFLPLPDRPWRDDATSHAPTIGRKRRHSVTEQHGDGSSSSFKRPKNEPVESGTECVSGAESPKGDAVLPAEGKDVKEVTKGVKRVELEDGDKLEDASIRPDAVPLPDSPSESSEPDPESQELEREPEPASSDEVEEEHANNDRDSVASSSPEHCSAGEGAETEPVTTNPDTAADEIASALQVNVVESAPLDIPEILEVKA